MDLWIRSQDRESIFKVKSIFYSTNNENKHFVRSIIVDDIKNGIMALGQYSSKERALEVLDEIQELLKPKAVVKAIDTSAKIDDDLVYRPQQNMEIKPLSNTIVYEMPKE